MNPSSCDVTMGCDEYGTVYDVLLNQDKGIILSSERYSFKSSKLVATWRHAETCWRWSHLVSWLFWLWCDQLSRADLILSADLDVCFDR